MTVVSPATPVIESVETFRVPPRWILVRLTTSDGAQGWGEAIVPKRWRAVVGAVDDLAANVIGMQARRIEDAAQSMRIGGFFRGGPVLSTAAAAIEQALWDVKGRRHGTPVYDFLGGPVRESVRVYAWIGGDRPEGVVEAARARREQGFDAVKMNATEELDFLDGHAKVDGVIARIGALRDEFGFDLDIALDFHGRVHRTMAKPLLAELEQFRPLWVEEPLPPGHEDALAELARVSGAIPLALGERLYSRWEFTEVLRAGVVDVLQPDVSMTGLFELEKICRMAEAHDVPVAPHCPNGPVCLAASLQVAFCTPNVPIHEQSFGLHYNLGYAGLPPGEMFDYVTDPEPLRPVAGALRRTDNPGLGIDVDPTTVTSRAGAWDLPDPGWRLPDGRLAEW